MLGSIVVKYREALTDKDDWWELHEPFRVQLTNGRMITIPVGYVTDFASVPQWLWSVFPPIGKYNRAALIHDYLYDTNYQQQTLGEYNARKFADMQFLYFANKVKPEDYIRHYLMYWMVRWFGRSAWRAKK